MWLTDYDNEGILAFAKYLDNKKVPVWIRHVLVPTITDDSQSLERLGEFIGTLSNVKALDILPYHTLGKEKYKALGISYPLDNIPNAEKENVAQARKIVLEAFKKSKKAFSK